MTLGPMNNKSLKDYQSPALRLPDSPALRLSGSPILRFPPSEPLRPKKTLQVVFGILHSSEAPMNTQRWHHLKALFDEALAQPPGQRAAFLEQTCDDDELRREALSLLAFYDDDPEFMEQPVRVDALRVVAEETTIEQAGRRIGPYRLLREIGQGGMGTVYLAERADGQFEQQVALKLVRQGGPRAERLRRLRHERQILASLQHPNIARLYDGGVTDDGVPFLVMEYVEGLPINQYCDQHRLSTTQRLRLFRTVCAAVQYAHQNLVVHRDLKPSNIFVAHTGRVKLLDFGIAKLLDEDHTAETLPMTRTGMRVMTPEYASPEQVRGEAITTASDVYALGIILFELLTGHRPYAVRGLRPSAVERVICRQDPPRPSTAVLRSPDTNQTGNQTGTTAPTATPEAVSQARNTQPERLRRRLEGDLDNIVLKALQKEPGRRYMSVAALSEDVRRHLEQLPVKARPDTVGYRISKFVRRHTAGFAATVLVVLALVGGIFATVYQARVAAAERDRAEHRFNDVRVLANKLLFDLHDAIRDLPGATPARQMLVSNALIYLDTLHQATTDDPSLQNELAEAYERVGEIQGDPHFPNLGDMDGATESYRKMLALREDLWKRDTTNADARHTLANSYGRLAVVLSWGGDNDQAITLSEHALALLAPLLKQHPDSLSLLHDAGRIRSELGWWLVWAGHLPEALAHLDEAETLLTPLAQRQPDNLDLQIDLWRVFNYQTDGTWFGGDYADALHLLENKALPHLQALNRRFPSNPRVRGSLHTCFNKTGIMQEKLERLDEALAAYQEALHLVEALAATDSTDRRLRASVANSQEAIGNVLLRMKRPDEALATLQTTLATRQSLYDEDPENAETGNKLALTRRALCNFHLKTDQLETALNHCEQATTLHEIVVDNDPKNAVGRENLATSYAFSARVHRAMARRIAPQETRRRHTQEAVALYDKSLAIINALKAEGIDWSWSIPIDTLVAERAALAEPPP